VRQHQPVLRQVAILGLCRCGCDNGFSFFNPPNHLDSHPYFFSLPLRRWPSLIIIRLINVQCPMDPVVATALPNSGPTARVPVSSSPVQHSYGTRIRQNSIIKPSARLRQSPDPPAPPRRIKPVPMPIMQPSSPSNNMPDFPPLHVMLHPEDANSKVFLAIGRSFLSVVCGVLFPYCCAYNVF
jgi:hypothetical protein